MGAVVGAVRVDAELRQLSATQLVQDLSRLGIAEVVALGGLIFGEELER